MFPNKNQLSEQEGLTSTSPMVIEMRYTMLAVKYQEKNIPLIVLAGKEYGSFGFLQRLGAAKAPLYWDQAVIAEAYERIHRVIW